jgi:hypothetical protein
MNTKKEFAYTGLLRQPQKEIAHTEWYRRWEALSDARGILHPVPIVHPTKGILSESWLREIVIKMVRAHEPDVAHHIIAKMEASDNNHQRFG